jgi:diacylglycerol kinase
MEMLNTALEKMCDLVTKDFHPLIKCIKDVSAGAVLVCAAGSLLTGTIIFLPKIIQLLK